MPSSATDSTSLYPITLAYRQRRVDMAVPATLPLAELLPGFAGALSLLTPGAATQGFRALRSDGGELDQSLSLADQHVQPGEIVTLEAAGQGVNDLRFDDMVEAVGRVVEQTREPWTAGDSVRLSAYSAVGFFVAAALLLMISQRGSWLAAGTLVAGAMLVGLAAAVVARHAAARTGSVALAVTAPLLIGAAGFVGVLGSLYAGIVGAGLGVLVGSVAVFLLPVNARSVAAGPIGGGLLLVLWGVLVSVAHVSPAAAGALIATLATLATLAAPWFAMAQLPVRIAMAPQEVQPVGEERHLRLSVTDASALVVAVRVAAGAVITCVAWDVVVHDLGIWLMAAISLAAALGTRVLYDRIEVLIGVVTALAVLFASGASMVSHHPTSMLTLVLVATAAGAVVLANNVISPRARPAADRVADAVHVVALMALIPLASVIWGLI